MSHRSPQGQLQPTWPSLSPLILPGCLCLTHPVGGPGELELSLFISDPMQLGVPGTAWSGLESPVGIFRSTIRKRHSARCPLFPRRASDRQTGAGTPQGWGLRGLLSPLLPVPGDKRSPTPGVWGACPLAQGVRGDRSVLSLPLFHGATLSLPHRVPHAGAGAASPCLSGRLLTVKQARMTSDYSIQLYLWNE